MIIPEFVLMLILLGLIFSSWGTYFLLKHLHENQIWQDVPVARSNHVRPVPKGAGVIIILSFAFIWLNFNYFILSEFQNALVFVFCLGILAIISLYDDIREISPLPRLFVHIICGIIAVQQLHKGNIFLPEAIIPPFVEKLCLIMGFAYFINIYNFMDGIDGLTGINTLTVSLTLAITFYTYSITPNLIYMLAILSGLMIGFLFFNWHPAKIFIGDVGSIPVGFMIAYCNLHLVMNKRIIEFLIINFYYLFDATYTLCKRLLRGEKIWHAHSEHIFQQAVRKGYSHSKVSLIIGLFNLTSFTVYYSLVMYL